MAEQAYLDLYVSWACANAGGCVKGRVLEGERPDLGDRSDNWMERLWNTFELVETDEIANVDVNVELAGGLGSTRARTNKEGFFEARFAGPLPAGSLRAIATLPESRWIHEPAHGLFHVFPDVPGLGVISDIDDTVLISGVTRKLEFLKRIAFSTPNDLETYPGAAELFQQFHAAAMPCFFVSGSPWNIEPRLRAFFNLRGFPSAPLQLKDMGIDRDADDFLAQVDYKVREIRELLAALPQRRFVLLGDSGQQDPEVYAQIQREFPDRVAATCIIRVTDEQPASPRFAGQFLCNDYRQVTAHLQALKLIATA